MKNLESAKKRELKRYFVFTGKIGELKKYLKMAIRFNTCGLNLYPLEVRSKSINQ